MQVSLTELNINLGLFGFISDLHYSSEVRSQEELCYLLKSIYGFTGPHLSKIYCICQHC